MKKIAVAVLVIVLCFSLMGCWTFQHQVGSGAATGVKVEKKQWFILWGLVPLNEVDSKAMAGGAENYTVQTQQSFVDVVIGVVTGWVTIYPQTVTVTK